MKRKFKLDRQQWRELANGIASGDSFLKISGVIGIDRTTISMMFADPAMLEALARRIGTPGALSGESLDRLLSTDWLNGERTRSRDLRLGFHEALKTIYPEWFDKHDAKVSSRAQVDDAEIEREIEADGGKLERNAECLRADHWNLRSLCIILRREWENGTPGEIERGLSTPEDRRRWRESHGIKFSTAGFGCYYSPGWSAARCRMHYAETDGRDIFGEEYDTAWREIEAEDNPEYWNDPLVRRDANMPTDEKAARELFARVSGGKEKRI